MDSTHKPSNADGAVPEDDAEIWQEIFQRCEDGLRSFLRNRLQQDADVDDCLQAVYVKMVQNKRDIPLAVRQAWLFRVASNQAALIWRRRSTTGRVLEKHAGSSQPPNEQDSVAKLIQSETVQRALDAIDQLPETTKQIIQLRLNDNLTFQQIADRLNIPLGTALTRMRRALEKIRNEIE